MERATRVGLASVRVQVAKLEWKRRTKQVRYRYSKRSRSLKLDVCQFDKGFCAAVVEYFLPRHDGQDRTQMSQVAQRSAKSLSGSPHSRLRDSGLLPRPDANGLTTEIRDRPTN